MKKKLSLYVDKGRVTGYVEVKEEPVIAVNPDPSKIKPLKKMKNYEGQFLAVDCSTRTLKRANNWGIYLMRATYASVKGRDVNWGFYEKICTVIGDARTRMSFLQDFRIELESQIALNILSAKHTTYMGDIRRTYLLLDGGGYFGGERKFRVSLYEKCEKDGINLLAISKNSPSLHDEKGRDFIAATYMISPYGVWYYHPILEADKDKHLYGDISIVKLSEESSRVFRCDIMEYLTGHKISEVLSPLTFVSEDPRCLGYPIPLFLAHKFSVPSEAMLLHYYDQVENALKEAELLDILRKEELACSFPDELHGVKYAFDLELVEHV
jgi:hypothetical protein